MVRVLGRLDDLGLSHQFIFWKIKTWAYLTYTSFGRLRVCLFMYFENSFFFNFLHFNFKVINYSYLDSNRIPLIPYACWFKVFKNYFLF